MFMAVAFRADGRKTRAVEHGHRNTGEPFPAAGVVD
jgi:hypothetical protein